MLHNKNIAVPGRKGWTALADPYLMAYRTPRQGAEPRRRQEMVKISEEEREHFS